VTRHARTEPITDDTRLIVAVTSDCFTRTLTLPNGWPRLVIDYGGSALVLDAVDPVVAEAFAFGLAHDALGFSGRCRWLMGGGP